MSFNNKVFSRISMLMSLAILLTIVGYYIPFLNIISFISGSVFVIIGLISQKPSHILGSFLAYIMLLFIFIGPIGSVSYAMIFALPCVVMGYVMKTDKSQNTDYIVGTVITAFSIMICFSFIVKITGLDFFKQMQIDFDQSIQIMKSSFDNVQIPQEFTGKYISEMMRTLFPSIIFMIALITTVLNKHFAIFILKRVYKQDLKFKPFSEFFISDRLGIIFIIFYLLSYVVTSMDILDKQYMQTVNTNILYCFIYMLMMQGIAVVIYFIEKLKSPTKTIAKIAFILFFLYISMFLPFLAIIDTAFDFRKLRIGRIK